MGESLTRREILEQQARMGIGKMGFRKMAESARDFERFFDRVHNTGVSHGV